jgi:hypothetical protein
MKRDLYHPKMALYNSRKRASKCLVLSGKPVGFWGGRHIKAPRLLHLSGLNVTSQGPFIPYPLPFLPILGVYFLSHLACFDVFKASVGCRCWC